MIKKVIKIQYIAMDHTLTITHEKMPNFISISKVRKYSPKGM